MRGGYHHLAHVEVVVEGHVVNQLTATCVLLATKQATTLEVLTPVIGQNIYIKKFSDW